MTFKIEKGLPVPRSHGVGYKYPWRELQPGDSFFVPDSDKCRQSVMQSVSSLGRALYGRGAVTARRVDGGIRFWRVK